MKTILDNVENQTGGRVRYTWPTKFDEQWVDRTGVKQDIPPPANVRGTPMDVQVSRPGWPQPGTTVNKHLFLTDVILVDSKKCYWEQIL